MEKDEFDRLCVLVRTSSGGKSFVRMPLPDEKLQVVTNNPDGGNTYRELSPGEVRKEFGEIQRSYNIITVRISLGIVALIVLAISYFWPVVAAFFGIGG